MDREIKNGIGKVYIERGVDPYKTTRRILKKIRPQVKSGKVLIKPNLTTNASSSEGITTDINVCRAILENLRGCEIVIGDCGSDMKRSLEVNGYYKLGREFGIEIKDLNDDEIVMKGVPNPISRFKKIPIAKTALDSDYIIDVAKLKIHALAQVTLTMKNMFGVIPKRRNRVRIHPYINEAIVDILQIVYPNFCIIDGIVGNEKDEVFSNPVMSEIIIAGKDAIATDSVGIRCMNLKPESVRHYVIAERVLGKRDVVVKGARIEEVKKTYKTNVPISTRIRYLGEKSLSYLYPRFEFK